MKNFLALALLFATVSAQSQWLRFEFVSDPGDYIGQGQTRDTAYLKNPVDTAIFEAVLGFRETLRVARTPFSFG